MSWLPSAASGVGFELPVVPLPAAPSTIPDPAAVPSEIHRKREPPQLPEQPLKVSRLPVLISAFGSVLAAPDVRSSSRVPFAVPSEVHSSRPFPWMTGPSTKYSLPAICSNWVLLETSAFTTAYRLVPAAVPSV